MNNTLIIGAGGVGKVVVYKCLMNKEVFGNITLASRTLKRCKEIQEEVDISFII
jgi:saccharopine dehydrogenase (NAD+, L-lysine-forming)